MSTTADPLPKPSENSTTGEGLASSDLFSPTFYRRMLHRQVMVIAKTRIDGTWKAYCFPVPGKNHEHEEYLWETEGVQLDEKLARQMFGFLEDVPYAD